MPSIRRCVDGVLKSLDIFEKSNTDAHDGVASVLAFDSLAPASKITPTNLIP
jgi:hypothetical protein